MKSRPVLSLIALGLISGQALAQSRPALADATFGEATGSLLSAPADASFGSRVERPVDDVSDTVFAGDSTSARSSASLSGTVNQSSNGGEQDLDVAGVTLGAGSTGIIEARGLASGRVSQTQNGGRADNSQSASVGSIRGRVGALTRTDATVAGSLTQTQTGGGEGGRQQQIFEVASVRDTRAAVETSGLVTGEVIQTLDDSARFAQDIRVGSVADATATRIATDGVSTGALSQSAGRGNRGSQLIGIASARDIAGARSLDLHGQALGDLQQIREDDATFSRQAIQIGGADRVDGPVDATTRGSVAGAVVQRIAGASLGAIQTLGVAQVDSGLSGRVEANGTVNGEVTQENAGAGSGGAQVVEVALVRASEGGTIRTSATLDGPVLQHISGSASAGGQIFNLGVASRSRAASITTDAVMEGRVSQVLSGTAGGASQQLNIASVLGAAGSTLDARAHVSGDVTQILLDASPSSQRRAQEVSLGEISGSGTNLSTDVSVTGSILQADRAGGRGVATKQRVTVGSLRSE